MERGSHVSLPAPARRQHRGPLTIGKGMPDTIRSGGSALASERSLCPDGRNRSCAVERTFSYYPSEPYDAYAMCGTGPSATATTHCGAASPGSNRRALARKWTLRFWSGCYSWSTNLSCGGNGRSDRFFIIKQMKLSDAPNTTLYSEQCRHVCPGNCTYRAYVTANVSGRGERS